MRLKYYHYQAVKLGSPPISGKILAYDRKEAAEKLLALGLLPRAIKLERRTLLQAYRELRLQFGMLRLLPELANLLQAGIPLFQALSLLISNTNNSELRAVLQALLLELEAGQALSQALSQYPRIFKTLHLRFIAAAEQTGQLDQVLQALADQEQRQLAFRKQLMSSLSYPLLVLCLALILLLTIVHCLIPELASFFQAMAKPLPAFTQALLHLAQQLDRLWPLLLALGLGLCYWLYYTNTHSKPLALFWERQLLRLPYWGLCLRQSWLLRFSQLLCLSLESGLALFEALSLSLPAVGSLLLEGESECILAALSQGQSLVQSLSHSRLFPTDFLQIIAIAENSGKLQATMQRLARQYEQSLQLRLALIAKLLEPALMLALGGFIAVMVFALYLPLFQLGALL